MFWRLTPRLYLTHMKGAGQRAAFQRADMAEAVFVGTHAGSSRDVERYIDAQRGTTVTLPPEAMAGVLRSASAGMTTITYADYLKMKES